MINRAKDLNILKHLIGLENDYSVVSSWLYTIRIYKVLTNLLQLRQKKKIRRKENVKSGRVPFPHSHPSNSTQTWSVGDSKKAQSLESKKDCGKH